jgi:hypothetical protein
VAKSEGRKSLRDINIDRRIILKSFLKKYNGRAWTGFIWLRIRDHWRSFVKRVINGPFYSKKCGEFMKNYLLLKKDSASRSRDLGVSYRLCWRAGC